LMWMLVKYAWPSHLEQDAAPEETRIHVEAQEDEGR